MRSHPRIIAVTVCCVAAIGMTALAGLHGAQESNDQNKGQKKTQKMIEAENRLPVADYDGAEPADPEKQQKRIARGNKYEKSDLVIDPYADVVSNTTHWAQGLSDIPAANSNVIVVGAIVDAQAYMTHSRKRIYSEFTVQVSEVLKDDKDNQIRISGSITVDRLGGRIRFNNGKVGQYFIVGQNMPQVGHQYILFLTESGIKDDYNILTGYEIRDGLIFPLDNPGSDHPMTKREADDATSFLNEVRAAITNS